MTILHISDTHGKHDQLKELPLADILVHSGDFTEDGTEQEVICFLEWFISLPHPQKIIVAGNHDTCLRGESIEGLPNNCHYLDCSSVKINGITFYGVPLFMEDVKEGIMDMKYSQIPTGTDVLITHQPPIGIMDGDESLGFGNTTLLARVLELRPRIHLYGHAHGEAGMQAGLSTAFSNGAATDEFCNIVGYGNKISF